MVPKLCLDPAAGADVAGFLIPAFRRVRICQFELPGLRFVSRLDFVRRAPVLNSPPACLLKYGAFPSIRIKWRISLQVRAKAINATNTPAVPNRT
jgi:hypothetical protein